MDYSANPQVIFDRLSRNLTNSSLACDWIWQNRWRMVRSMMSMIKSTRFVLFLLAFATAPLMNVGPAVAGD